MSANSADPSTLPILDWSGFGRVLVVVAHPDDAEYGLSTAVNHWTRNGVEVAYLLLTHGEAGIRTMPPEQAGPVRAREQRAACDAVGVGDLTILDHPDSRLTESLELRRDIAAHIRRFRPDTVVTANFDVEAYGGFNQADHRVAGQVTVDAVSAADNPWSFPDLGAEPWGASRILIAGPAEPTHRMPVDEEDIRAGVVSLAAHETYWEALPDDPAADAGTFIRDLLADAGGPVFRVVDLD